ncbi:hypothetical protein [Saccharibacillus qingshengii]|uniref:hypothetical protein n=1 Tax=Saccharibacillus qingshengii TaxID=1763540 RepID=UPI0015578096|nr:hypothetical protein [Saccharibacillus qingshengii]
MPIYSFLVLLTGIALMGLGAFYLKKGTLPAVEPYRKNEHGERSADGSREKAANLAAGAAFMIAGLILILFFTTVSSLFS